ncbi:MAG: hypothetical protein Barrevirus3_16 [Barrevirus sp.]|uniref:Uncharacterized protein n=1 Tax=Barrevirus sp. TaxID=2487763 RepID=A0A3G4ZPT3_9VIRU|nr:MAG: hypothetical protein Barrevirus3_16 [Barrevirus sp.]
MSQQFVVTKILSRPVNQGITKTSSNNKIDNQEKRNARRLEAIKRFNYLRTWLHKQEALTVQDLLTFTELDDRINLLQLLIKNVLEHNEYLPILKQLAQQSYLPKTTQRTEDTRYSLYNIAAFIKTCSKELFKELIDIIHLFGYSIFEQNNKGENAFMAILSENNTLITQEKYFRYMMIAFINQDQITKLINSSFNKLNSEDKITLDRLRYALCINPNHFIKTVATLFIKKKCADSCIIHDLYMFKYVKMISLIFNSVDKDHYDAYPVTDKSLTLFFKLNVNREMNALNLYQSLWQNLCLISLPNNEDITANKIYDIQSLAISIGAFANVNQLLSEYRLFILDCLNTQNSKIISLEPDERPKIAIRAIIHARKVSTEILNALNSYPIKDGFTVTTILRLSDMKDSIYQIKSVNGENRDNGSKKKLLDIELLNFFDGIDNTSLDIVLDDTTYILQKAIQDYPDKKFEIIQRLLFCLFRSIKNPENIETIIKGLFSCITKNDILRNKRFIEMNIIPTVNNPASVVIWNTVRNCL